METLMLGKRIKYERKGIAYKKNININYFDENEKQNKNHIITWCEADEFPIFSEDKRRSQSKKYKRIGRHLVLTGEVYDLHNSPNLKACEGCDRNISKKKGTKECLIYIENEISRKIEKRKEDEFIKPYETLNNILKKNIWLRNYTKDEKNEEIYNKKIELIDNMIRADENFVELIKNSIFEDRDTIFRVNRFYLLIDVMKNKSGINEKGKRTYFYNIVWKIRNSNIESDREEIIFLANHECSNENEFKIILRSIIVGLLILNKKSDIILGINEKLCNLIFEFINNFSNRRKIDSDYYLELLFIENFLENNEISLTDADENSYNKIKDIRAEMRKMLKDKAVVNKIKHSFEILDEALLTNEYNLIWNNRIITGGYRACNRINFSQRQCGDKDTIDRSYRIKNILKERPTYKTLYKRNTNKIDTPKCIRCGNKEDEDWEHIWICEDNEFSIDEIIQESPYRLEKKLATLNKDKEIKILRDHLCNFLTIIESPSVILRGKNRKWELIRGIYNNKFNELSDSKEDRMVIKKLWTYTYEEIKKRLWIPRCEEIKRLEEKEQIKKSDLRKKKIMMHETQENILEIDLENDKIKKTEENIEKARKNNTKKQINIVTLGKLAGAVTDGINIERTWDTTFKLPNY
ncbi:hypothetical protein RhiirC2_791518 [Rhizophagus irregularis]|uniref:Uncharacterized protein n=1 Tax=Rhizophagus irregularis TaxID=588596 RepID=A0A2N1MJ44_9GLOM|nr:hypothetical protein RhiirC2_791518 [Rhizophagus irregularis]